MNALIYYHSRRLLNSPATAVFLACGWAAAVLLTFVYGHFIAANRADLTLLFTYLPWVMAVLVPALCMPMAAEARNGITERLLTLPFTPPQRLLARFFTYWALMALWLAGFWPMVATLFYLGAPDVGPILTGFLGMLLVAGFMLALCLLACSRARNGVVGLLIGMVLCLALVAGGTATAQGWVQQWACCGHMPHLLYAVLNTATLSSNVLPFVAGLLPLPAAARLAAAAGFLLLAAMFWGSRWRAATPLAALTAAITALAILLSFLNIQWDATANHRHSLSPAAVALVKNIQQPVTITLYHSLSNPDIPPAVHRQANAEAELLRQIQKHNVRFIHLKMVNPDTSTTLAMQAVNAGAEEQSLPTGTTYFTAVTAATRQAQQVLPVLPPQSLQEYVTLGMLTRLTQPHQPLVVVYGAAQDSSQPWQAQLQQQATVHYAGVDDDIIPAQTNTVILFGNPALPPDTLNAVTAYLKQGGNVLLLADPLWRNAPATQTVEEGAQPFTTQLPQWGLQYDGDAVVADSSAAALVMQPGSGSTAYPLWINLAAANMEQMLPFTHQSQPVVWAEGGQLSTTAVPPNLALTPIFTSNASAQAVPVTVLQTEAPQQAATHIEGPAASRMLAAMLSGPFGDDANARGNLVVMADADWLAPALTAHDDNANLSFFAGLMEYLLGTPQLIQLRAKATEVRPLTRVEDIYRDTTRQTTRLEQKLLARLYTINQNLEGLNPESSRFNRTAQAETESFRQQQFAIRQQLRALRQQARQRLTVMENSLIILNLLFMPMLLLALTWLMRRRRKKAAS